MSDSRLRELVAKVLDGHRLIGLLRMDCSCGWKVSANDPKVYDWQHRLHIGEQLEAALATPSPMGSENEVSITIRGREQVACVMKALHDAGFVTKQMQAHPVPQQEGAPASAEGMQDCAVCGHSDGRLHQHPTSMPEQQAQQERRHDESNPT